MRATLGACALILGAVAFLVFWGSDVSWDDKLLGVAAAWWIRLAVHGIAIVLITLGLILRYWMTPAGDSATRYERIAAGASVAGLLTALPLFFVGIALLGVATIVARGLLAVGLALLLGAVLFAVTYGSGVRLGFEDGPPLSQIDKVLATSSITLLTIGICALGVVSLQQRNANAISDVNHS